MCQDFSGIITEKGEVLWLKENTGGHVTVQNKFGLKDVDDSKTWVRFEIHYKDNARISRDREDAEFKWDCQTLPKWAEKNAVSLIAKAWVAWDESRKTAVILAGETVAEVKDYYVAHCLGNIGDVYGSATIGSVCGSAIIRYVCGSATIGSVCGSAIIRYVCGSATIGYVCGSAIIRYVCGSATIGYVYDSATIKYVCGSATIENVCGSATILKIEDCATVQKNGVLYLAKNVKTRKIGKVLK